MRVATRLAALCLLGGLVAGCSADSGSPTATASKPTNATIRGIVALTDSQGGIWAVQSDMTPGSPCATTQVLVPGLASGPPPFPPDAQVTVHDGSGRLLGAASLASPTSGIVAATPQRPGSYYCEFGWQITVPTASLYSFEFPNATPQTYNAQALPGTVVLSIGNGVGFTPQQPIGG